MEAALAQYPAVEEAVVVARRALARTRSWWPTWWRGLPSRCKEELRRYLLEERLPGYMQPAVIEQLERLPRLATGKPDRRRLPAVERGTRRGKEGYLAPRLLTAPAAGADLEELLEARPIGIRDNFFDLGGHSLLAAQLVGRIEQAYGKRLALSTLFAKPTIEQLAVALQESAEEGKGKARMLPLQTEGSRRPFFFLHGDWTGGAFYCFALARACGAEQPFYVLEPYEFSDRDGPPTLEAIASAHIEAMRGVQARGTVPAGRVLQRRIARL